MDFVAMPKIPRLSREVVISEKLDGTNAQVYIVNLCGAEIMDPFFAQVGDMALAAGSRTKWITPGKQTDNYGFAQWVRDHAEELVKLGPGQHFGEWWGKGIQRGYGLLEKRFSLFNTSRWTKENTPDIVSVVPELYRGIFDTSVVEEALKDLRVYGSKASLGFKDPEGVVIFHTASGQLFKKTVRNDEQSKNQKGGS